MPSKVYNVYDEEPNPLPVESILFPGGEYHFQLDPVVFRNRYIWIDSRCQTPGDFLELVTLIDAIKGCNPKKLGLFLPYFPGARQDRRTAPGTPFTLRLYASILNSLKLDVVVSVDVHSIVAHNEVNNLVNIYPQILAGQNIETKYDGVIQPDAGGAVRATHFSWELVVPLYVGGKKRDPKTGKLSGFTCDPLLPGKYLIADDICDGGGTFVGLADEIHKQPGIELDLWVTHGIFSKGFFELEKRFRNIYTTDSVRSSKQYSGEVKIFPLWNTAARIMRERIST